MTSKKILFSTDLPQADNVYRLFDIIRLVSEGRWRYVHFKHDLGITYRQGRYYKTATEILDLTYRDNLTKKGKEFMALSEIGKRVYMKRIILDLDAVRIYNNIRKTNVNVYDSFKKHIAFDELSDSTIKRRIQTLESWLIFCDSLSSFLDNGSNNIISIEKNLDKTKKALEQHEKLVKMMKNHMLSKTKVDVFEDRLVDLIAIKKDKIIFFEMKSINDENKGSQLKKAIGQLVFYKNLFGASADLVIVLDKYFSDIDYLINDPIKVIWRDKDSFQTDELTKKQLEMVFK